MNKLKSFRLDRNLSQYELSAASSVPRYVIQLCESGIRLPKQLERVALAETLGVSVAELFPVRGGKND